MKCRSCNGAGRDGAGKRLTPVVPSRPFSRIPALYLLFFLLCAPPLSAQALRPLPEVPDLQSRARLAVGQNFADYLMLGTLNADLQYSVHRSWTLQAGARYNGWTFRHRSENQFQARQQTYCLGARWWPWYTYSGWWAGARLQYQEYNRGGILSPETEEGDAYGMSLGGGYALHLNHWLNVDFGLYGWGGMTRYVRYACPYCGRRTDSGTRPFVLPDEVRIALQFIF